MTGERDTLREAVLGELIHGDDQPGSGWFILGVNGYFDVDNAVWCEFQEGDAPWDSEHFDLHGTIPPLAARAAADRGRLARVEALLPAIPERPRRRPPRRSPCRPHRAGRRRGDRPMSDKVAATFHGGEGATGWRTGGADLHAWPHPDGINCRGRDCHPVLVLDPADPTLRETILRTLGDDHSCLHHNGPNTGPCRTCKRRTDLLLAAIARRQP